MSESSTENAGQVLHQVQDHLRSTLRVHESALFAFQLIAWAGLSDSDVERIPQESLLPSVLPHGSTGIAEALSMMATSGGLVGQAFSDAPAYARLAGESLVAAAGAAARFAATGMFSRFPADEILGFMLSSSRDHSVVPSELAKLMIGLAVTPGQNSIYCPWESTGQLVAALIGHEAKVLVETPWQASLPALMALMRVPPTTVMLVEPLRNPTAVKEGRLERFEASLAFPPMGIPINDDVVSQDLLGRFPIKKATATGLMIQHVVAQTAGRAAVVVPNSFLFGPGKDRDVREHLVSRAMVEAVVALPVGIHQSTNVPTALLLINTGKPCGDVRFVDASLPYFQGQTGRGRTSLSRIDEILQFCLPATGDNSIEKALDLDDSLAMIVGADEILANDASLQVDRYVMPAEQRKLQAQLGALPTVSLDEIAVFIQPLPNKDRGTDGPTALSVFEVGAADIPSTGYIRRPERPISVQLPPRRSGNPEDVFLRPYDLVLIVKGSVGKIGVVPRNVPPPGINGWIAGQSAIVLRGKTANQDLRGLALWLRSPMGRKLLDSIRSGAAIQMLSINELRRLGVIAGLHAWTEMAVEVLEREDDLQHQIEILQDEQASIAEDLWEQLRIAANDIAEK